MITNAKTCQHCQTAISSVDIFCAACGAYIGVSPEPEIFRRTRRQIRATRWSCILFTFLSIAAVLPIPICANLIMDMLERGMNVTHLTTFVLWFGAIGAIVLLWRRASGPYCSSCGGRIVLIGGVAGSALLRGAAPPFCIDCGTRIQPGDNIVPPHLRTQKRRDSVEVKCPICGRATATEKAGWCSRCGANLQLQELPIERQACPCCDGKLYPFVLNDRSTGYCSDCGHWIDIPFDVWNEFRLGRQRPLQFPKPLDKKPCQRNCPFGA